MATPAKHCSTIHPIAVTQHNPRLLLLFGLSGTQPVPNLVSLLQPRAISTFLSMQIPSLLQIPPCAALFSYQFPPISQCASHSLVSALSFVRLQLLPLDRTMLSTPSIVWRRELLLLKSESSPSHSRTLVFRNVHPAFLTTRLKVSLLKASSHPDTKHKFRVCREWNRHTRR